MTCSVTRTTVGIVGAGPAGLMLSHLLGFAGIESVVVDHRSRSRDRDTPCARESSSTTASGCWSRAGVSDRVLREGKEHQGIDLGFGGRRHRIDFQELAGASVWLYPQTEVFIDLAAARERDGGDVRFGVGDTTVVDVDARSPGHPVRRRRGDRARGALRLPGRRGRLPQHHPPAAASRSAAARLLPRVPVRLVRHPVRRAEERSRS